MAKKIKKINVASDKKGTVKNPYTIEEHEQMLAAGQWTEDGFVEELGLVEGETSSNGFFEENIKYGVYGDDGELMQFVEHTTGPVIATAGNFKCKCTATFFITRDFGGGITNATVYIEIEGMNNTAYDPDINNDRIYTTLGTQTSPICTFHQRGFTLSFNQEIVINTSVLPDYKYTNKVFHLQLNGNVEMQKDDNGLVFGAIYEFEALGNLSDF